MINIFSQKRPRYGEDPNFVPNTVIGEGVTVMGGVIKGINSVLVSGLVFGDINVDGEVIVAETGYVKGSIMSTFAVVAGIVEGNLQLSSYASLKSTGSVTGDISCTAISIEDGAVFSGACNMIVKSGSLNKKLKKINETAISMRSGESVLLGTSEIAGDVAEIAAEDSRKILSEVLSETVSETVDEPSEDFSGSELEDTEEESAWYSLDHELEEDNAEESESKTEEAAAEETEIKTEIKTENETENEIETGTEIKS